MTTIQYRKDKFFQKWSGNFRQEDLVILDGIWNDVEQSIKEVEEETRKETNSSYLKGFIEGFDFIYNELKTIDGACGASIGNRIYQQVQIVNELKEKLSITNKEKQNV